MPISFTLERTVRADSDTVFSVLTDHRGLAAISPIRKSTLDREGTPDADGVGAVRRLTVAGPPLVEEVTRYERPARFAYKLLSGLPVRDHTGDVELTPTGPARAQTLVRYHLDSTPAIPGTGVPLGLILKAAIGSMLNGIVKESEQRAGG